MCLMSYANNKGADQPCYLLARQYNISRFYSRNFKALASFCGCAGWFVSCLVGNPEDRFSRDEAHVFSNKKQNKHKRSGNCFFLR